jgi:hypothetical protein
VVARFVTLDPSAAKVAAAQSGDDPFSAFVGFHEVGLAGGAAVDIAANGNATVNYQCIRTDGTLGAAPGSNQVVTASVTARQRFIADAAGEVQGVIVIRPPAPTNPNCPPGYAMQPWRSAYAQMVLTDSANGASWQAPDIGGQAQ